MVFVGLITKTLHSTHWGTHPKGIHLFDANSTVAWNKFSMLSICTNRYWHLEISAILPIAPLEASTVSTSMLLRASRGWTDWLLALLCWEVACKAQHKSFCQLIRRQCWKREGVSCYLEWLTGEIHFSPPQKPGTAELGTPGFPSEFLEMTGYF